MENEEQLNIYDLFTKKAKPPFFYNIKFSELNENSTNADCFTVLTKLFIEGLNIISEGKIITTSDNNEKKLNISEMTEKEFESIKERFLSLGIEPQWKVYDKDDKDYHLRSVCYEVEKIEDCELEVTINWKTQQINKMNFTVNENEAVSKLIEVLEKHPVANFFLEIKKPTHLNEFIIKWFKLVEPDKLNIINFNKAKISDYHYKHQMCTDETRHIR